MDKTAAQIRADAQNTVVEWLCPLDKLVCNPKCYCFAPAKASLMRKATEKDMEEWRVISPWCSNYMFSGEN